MNLVTQTLEKQLDTEFPSLLQTQSAFRTLYNVADDSIGRGRYAVVKLCTRIADGKTFAGKFIKKRRRNEILKELRVLQFSHLSSHVVSLVEVHEINMDLVILLEHARGGDLQTLLEDKTRVTEEETRKIITGLLNALVFLHSLRIIHLDIKPQNILLLNPWPDTTVRLCDFGLSRTADDDMPQEIAGTADYIAPEVIGYDELTTACDIWSTGVVAYVLLSGLCPFQGENSQEVFVSITKGQYDFPDEEFSSSSESSKSFISQALSKRAKLRPTAEQALCHDWIAISEEQSTSSISNHDNPDDPKSFAVSLVEQRRDSCSIPPLIDPDYSSVDA